MGKLSLLAALLLVACGCDRRKASGGEGTTAAPAASEISIVNAFGACDDVPLCEKECDAGASDRCRRLGVTYQFGNFVPKDERRALSYYEIACKLGNPSACLSSGQMYEYHHGVEKDDARGAAFYKQSCDLGYSPGCANYAIMLETGRGVPKDLARATSLYDGACKEGAGLACDRLRVLRAAAADH